jgi:hypothetical protein
MAGQPGESELVHGQQALALASLLVDRARSDKVS